MTYEGSCHCGKIAYAVAGEIDAVLECNCSICSRKGYQLWFVSRANVDLRTLEDDMASYTFNTHKIRHMFCSTCGCSPFGFGTDPDGNETAAINVRCLQDVDLSTISVNHYDGRSA